MSFAANYLDDEPTRDEVDNTRGALLLEFGADWCGHCQGLSHAVEEVLKNRQHVAHIRVADGRGKPLGRSFRVKLWPTFVLLHDGEVLATLVRPTPDQLHRVFDEILPA